MSPDSVDTRTAAETGTALAEYRIVSVLGRGAEGSAFRAEAPDGSPVTLHVLRRPAGKGAVAQFSERAELLARLSGPGLPRLLGFGDAPEGLWVASAEVQGVSLRNLLVERVTPMRAVRLLSEVADALDAAHGAGLTHGDVHPENVMVQMRPVESAVLVNFALVPPPARSRVAAERIPYSAPEVLRGAGPRPTADVFALAMVLYECLAGALPPTRGERAEPEQLRSGLPTSLNATIARGLAADPAARPASAAELMGEATRAFLDPAGPAPWATSGGEESLSPTPRSDDAHPTPRSDDARPTPRRAWRRRTLGALTAALVVGGAGTAGYAVSRESTPNDATPAPRTATAGVVSVAVPEGWERSRAAVEGAQPSLFRPVALQSSDPPGRIEAGLASDRAAVLDPSRLAAEAARGTPRPRQVRLGQLAALRFEGNGATGPSILYAAPTTAGTAAVVCSGNRASVAGPCAEVARGLAVRGARGYDPADGIAWMNRLAADMRRLRARRSAGLRRLRREARPNGQGRRAGQIASAYAASARRLRTRPAPPQAAQARRRVLTRLVAAERAYRSLARAASNSNRPAFRRAVQRVRRADGRLQATLRAL